MNVCVFSRPRSRCLTGEFQNSFSYSLSPDTSVAKEIRGDPFSSFTRVSNVDRQTDRQTDVRSKHRGTSFGVGNTSYEYSNS